MENADLTPFHQAWNRFAAWLAEHSPCDHAELQGPATLDQLAEVEAAYGFPLHPEFKALLLIHNGTRAIQPSYDLDHFQAGSFLPMGNRLNATDLIPILREGLRDTASEWADWQRGYTSEPLEAHADKWLPIAHANDGGFVFIDHQPGPTYGHIYESDDGGDVEENLWATSLTDLFSQFADALETNGTFKIYRPYVDELDPGQSYLDWDIAS